VESTNNEVHLHEFFFFYLSLLPSYVHVFSSAPCFQTPLLCALSSMWNYKFHALTNQLAASRIVYSNIW